MTATSTAEPDLRGKTVWAIDTLSRVYQLFHALPEMAAPDGTPVSAVFGLTRDLLDIVEKRRPDYLFCAIDPPGPTFRHERFAEYKANRAEMPADLVPQIPLVRRLLAVMGIPCLEAPGFEADDVLATLATRTSAGGGSCVIATSDKDARQLLSDSVRLLNLRTNTAFGAAELVEEWGVRPDQVVDFLSLVGDSVDNVPGVPGIGPKIAAELLQRHGTLDALLGRLDDVAGTKRRESLATHADQARRGRELIRLDTAVPIEIPWTAGMRHDPEPESLAEFLRAMGFRSLLSRVKSAAPQPPRGGARGPLLFDIDGPPVETPAVATPADEAAVVVAVTALRPPLTLCVVPAPGGSRRCRPVGLALSTDAATVWIGADLAAASGVLRGILADPSVPKQGHDLKRQDVALRTLGLRLAGLACDTMLASYLLESGERNLGLVETCVRQGVDVPASGPEAAALENPATADEAAVHCRAVRLLAARMPGLLDEAGLGTLYRDVELPLAALLADMESRGVRIDGNALARLSADYAARLAELERDIHALAGRPFSIASPVQVRGVLFDELGLPVVKRTKTGPSTDSEVLEELASLHPLPAKLLEHRKFAKLKSTYVDALPALVDPVSGRVHTTFNQAATATGRLSSSDPNLQNIPIRTVEGQQIREAFLPGDPDWRFVAADYSQIELRILAHLSGDDAMRRAFAGGEDIHTRTAAAVYGVSLADVTGAMRRMAKAVNFGILYGQSAFGLSRALGIPLDQAAGFIASYFETFAGAAAFIDRVLDGCRLEGRVTTMLGRRRQIAGVRDRDRRRAASGGFSLTLPERTAVNTVVQGSAADLIKLAMLRVAARLAAEGSRAALVLQIHDELLLECPAVETERVGRLVEEEMGGAMRLDVPLEVSVHAGGTWAACHA